MSSRKPTFRPTPRGWDTSQVCAWLGVSASWLRQNREALHRNGMPRPDPLTHRTDAQALEAWMNRRSGLLDHTPKHPSDTDASVEAVLRHARGHASA